MSSVIYLIEQPLDERNFDRFGIQTWVSRGWTLEIWDLTPLAFPRVWRDFERSGRQTRIYEGYFPITSASELKSRFMQKRQIDYFVDLTGDHFHSLRAKMFLIRAGAARVVCNAGSIPDAAVDSRGGAWKKLALAFTKEGALGVLRRAWISLVTRFAALFTRPKLIVASGERSLRAARATAIDQDIIRAHNMDYDIYLRLRGELRSGLGSYGVFLDQNICFAPDYLYAGVAPYATPERYFPTICRGLNKISEVLHAPIRIASHPRIPDRDLYSRHYCGMPVDVGKTGELIGNCGFVVCHYTTALQLAVLLRKPIIFVTTDQLRASSANGYIEAFASSLGKIPINLDDELDGIDLQRALYVDVGKYAAYQREFIKTDRSADIPYWDIIIDHIEQFRSTSYGGPTERDTVDRQSSGRMRDSGIASVRTDAE